MIGIKSSYKLLFVFLWFCVLNLDFGKGSKYTKYVNNTENFRNLAVSNDHVYVGGSTSIIQLNSTLLTVESVHQMSSYPKNLVLDVQRNNTLIVCNQAFVNVSSPMFCEKHLIPNGFGNSDLGTAVFNVLQSVKYMVTQFVESDVILFGSSTCLLQNDKCPIIDSLKLEDFTQTEFFPANNFVVNSLKESIFVQFATIFQKENFVYFLFSKDSKSRLGKMCSIKKGQPFKNSFENTPVQCVHNGSLYTLATYAVQWMENLYMSFSNGTDSVVCKYDFTDIARTFKESRKDRLDCTKNYSNKIFKEIPPSGWCYCSSDGKCKKRSSILNGNCTNVIGSDNEHNCAEEKSGFCNSTLFESVEGELAITSVSVVSYIKHTGVDEITKFEIQELNSYAILYIGTSKGAIGKVLINKDQTDGQFIGEFRIVYSGSPVLDIKVKEENVFVMTKEMIINIAEKDACPTDGFCEKCIESNNPTCGWDIFSGRCTSVSKASAIWLPSVGKKCLEAKSLEEYSLDENTANNKKKEIQFRFKFYPPVIPSGQSINCSISGQTPSTVSYDDNVFTCNISVSEDTSVSIGRGNVEFDKAVVKTYKCSNSSSCSTCVKDRSCNWCISSFTCVGLGESCTNGPKVNSKEDSACPRIDSTKVLQRVDSNTVYLKGSNLDNVRNVGLQCILDPKPKGKQPGNNEPDADINGTDVKCVFGQEALGIGDYSIKLAKNDNGNKYLYIDGSAELEVYDCKDDGCGKCKYKNSLGYKCYWCNGACVNNSCSEQPGCPAGTISIKSVDPVRGPRNGGTRITINFHEKLEFLTSSGLNVTVNGVLCIGVEVIRKSKSSISCITGDASTSNSQSGVIVNFFGSTSSPIPFEYVNQETINITGIHPRAGIKSGGRKITISGQNLSFSGSDYYIKFCTNSSINGICVDCGLKDAKISKGLDKVSCSIKGATFKGELTYLEVTIDNRTTLKRNIQFTILENPGVVKPTEKDSTVFKSGGSNILVKGNGFNEVDFIGFAGAAHPCRKLNSTEPPDLDLVECKAPPYVPSSFDRRRKRAVGQTTFLVFDNYQTSYTIYYAEDPVIYDLPKDIEFEDGSQPLLIEGDRLTAGATKDDYTISIGLDGQCFIRDFNDKNITCSPPKAAPRTNLSDENTVFVIVKVGGFEKNIGTITYTIALNILAIVVGVLAGLLVVAIVGGGAAYWKSKKNRKADQEKFALDLINLEKKISEDSKAEFAEAQMTIKNIKSDLVTTRVPYLDYQSYAFHQLFPNKDMETHPLLREPVVTDDRKKTTKEAMDMLNKLLTNKLFLKSLVKTLDNSVKKLTMQDKAHFSSLLSVALVGNMKLFYQLVICLLEETIKSASNKKQHKQLFRRFESISQRLTVNWLQLTLYDHLQKHNGMQLFMLYKAAQTVIEKGPIDAVTNHSRNTLAEESLLKTRVEFQTMKLNIDLNGTSDVKIPVEVLDCDTVSQVKHKCCTAIYKNKPASEIPSINDLELEWHAGRGGKLVLQDIDNISDRSNGMVRLNTLKHYLVKDGSDMALMYKEVDDEPQDIYENSHHPQTSPDSVKLLMPSDSVDNSDQNRWHLSNLTDEEKSNKDHEIGEIFLNRLFQTKLILKEYIDSAFGSITDPECLSVPVRYFLCQMDKLGKEVGADSGLLQTWKSQCYATRVWASLISKPQILFDVDVPSHVEPCMDILKQVVIESFTQGAQSVTKESSSQKLLFCNDIPEYRKQVHHFFVSVEDASDGEFWSSLEQISSMQNTQLQFSKQAVLDEIYKFISKHQNEILEDFEEQNEAKDMQFGSKLEAIIEKMEGC